MKIVSAAFVLLMLSVLPIAATSPKSWLELDAGETAESFSWNGGSGTLHVWGSFSGGPSVSLEWTSFNSAPFLEVDASNCTLTTADSFCNFSIGNGDLRVVITGGSGSDIVSARIGQPNQASIGGDGAGGGGSFADLTGGTNVMAAMVVGTGSSMSVTGSGTLEATALDYTGDGTLNLFNDVGSTRFDPDNDGTAEMSLTSAGRLGIGTTTPNANAILHIVGTASGAFNFDGGFIIDNINNSGINIVSGAANIASINLGDTNDATVAAVAYFNATNLLVFRTANSLTNRLVVAASGNVGIATDTPAELLDVNSFLTVSSSNVSVGAGLTLGLPPSASPPVACTAPLSGHLYWDTAQLLACRCDGTTWEGINVGGGGAVTCV